MTSIDPQLFANVEIDIAMHGDGTVSYAFGSIPQNAVNLFFRWLGSNEGQVTLFRSTAEILVHRGILTREQVAEVALGFL